MRFPKYLSPKFNHFREHIKTLQALPVDEALDQLGHELLITHWRYKEAAHLLNQAEHRLGRQNKRHARIHREMKDIRRAGQAAHKESHGRLLEIIALKAEVARLQERIKHLENREGWGAYEIGVDRENQQLREEVARLQAAFKAEESAHDITMADYDAQVKELQASLTTAEARAKDAADAAVALPSVDFWSFEALRLKLLAARTSLKDARAETARLVALLNGDK